MEIQQFPFIFERKPCPIARSRGKDSGKKEQLCTTKSDRLGEKNRVILGEPGRLARGADGSCHTIRFYIWKVRTLKASLVAKNQRGSAKRKIDDWSDPGGSQNAPPWHEGGAGAEQD